MTLEFLPIRELLRENQEFVDHPDCQDSIYMSILYYTKVGFRMPWIGYYTRLNNELVGCAAFKGKPMNGKVEIAYGTFPLFREQGIGTQICHQLVTLALQTDSSVNIYARTLAEENHSTKILKKNGFEWKGTVMDEEDGLVWEWKYLKRK